MTWSAVTITILAATVAALACIAFSYREDALDSRAEIVRLNTARTDLIRQRGDLIRELSRATGATVVPPLRPATPDADTIPLPQRQPNPDDPLEQLAALPTVIPPHEIRWQEGDR